MKPFIAIPTALLLLASFAIAKSTPQKDKNAQQQPQQQQQQQQQQQPAPPPTGTKTNPMAKTQEEATAYGAALQQTDPAALETAANDFATKYPDSQLRGILFQRVMLVSESAGNYDKAVEAGRKALTFDSDDPVTLSELASIIASRTRESDLDKEERYADATKFANAAIQNANDVRVDARAPAAAVEGLRNEVKSQSYNALGSVAFAKKNYAEAEASFQKAADATPTQPDPVTYLRLAIAQRNQGKYDQALATIDKTLQVAQAAQAASITQLAEQQKEDLQKLAAGKKK